MTIWTFIFGLFAICTLVQLYYILIVFGALAWTKVQKASQKPSGQAVSVLICAHNELENLKVLVPALKKQQYPNFQVVIALDRCTDGSLGWLEQLNWSALTLVNIRDTPPKINGKKHALLQAIASAEFDALLLTDADCWPSSNLWIQSMMDCFEEKTDIVLGYSPYAVKPGLLNDFIQYETLLTGMQYLSQALKGHPYMGVGRNMGYRKRFFNSTHNLQPYMQVTGGDDDLFVNKNATKTNTAVCLQEDSFMISKPKISVSAYLIQKKRHLSVGKLYNMRDKVILAIFSVSHIIFWSSLVSLLMTASYWVMVVLLFLIRQIVLTVVVARSSQRLGGRFKLRVLPLVDFLYSVYYGYIGLVALTSKKVKWH